MTTPYHAKYFAHELTRKAQPGGVDRVSMALFDACVDLNPHQIEAAMFALRSPISKGVVLADEVGLGKTIEAGLVLCQYWAERKRKLLVICPASLRKQWALELHEKFNLPALILDAKTYREAVRGGNGAPFAGDTVVITSFHFASRFRGDIRAVPFDLVVIDEAHKLRNAYRPSNKMGQNIKWAIEERKKCLLTATPLQNSLLELYGLSTILDDLIFGDANSFRTLYANAGADLNALRNRLQSFCQRTLRRQVVEYIQYTERIPITIRFCPTDHEQQLYEAVSDFLNRDETFSVPQRQRHLTALILRKLLASSSHAIANTLETMRARLEEMRDLPKQAGEQDGLIDELIENEELEDDYLDEILEGTTDEEEEAEPGVDVTELNSEIDELARYAKWARRVNVDLVETFNWLLGLTVRHIDVIRNVRVVEGTNPGGERVMVLWRDLDETDNDALDEWFRKQDYNTKDQEYDLIYVNGDNNLENLRRSDQTWKVRLIEEEFGRLMFDVQDV